MIKSILVALMGDGSDDATSSTALAAARLFGAHLEFLLVRPDPVAVLTALAAGDFATGIASPSFLADLEKEDRRRAAQAHRFFEDFCTRERIRVLESPPGSHGVSAGWREAKGEEWAIVAQEARASDLLVISPAREEQGPAPQTVEAALMEGGRPMLLAPRERPASLSRTIVVAWKDVPEAARAVTAAMPFLAEADKIIVLTVAESEADDVASLHDLAGRLRWHRFEVEAQCLRPDQEPAPRTLVKAARDAKADLIVMGGYGHSRLREMILGGFTRHILRGAELPVLLFH